MEMETRKWKCKPENGNANQKMEMQTRKWKCKPENGNANQKMEMQTRKWKAGKIKICGSNNISIKIYLILWVL